MTATAPEVGAPQRWLNARSDEGSHAAKVAAYSTARRLYERPERRDPRSDINAVSMVGYYSRRTDVLSPDVRLLGAMLASYWSPVGGSSSRAVTISDQRLQRMLLWTQRRLDAAREALGKTGEWTITTDGLAHLYVPTDALYKAAAGVEELSEPSRVLSKWVLRYSGLEAGDRVVALYVASTVPARGHRKYRLTIARGFQHVLLGGRRDSWSNDRLFRSGLMRTYTAEDGITTTYRFTEVTWDRLNEYSDYVWLRRRGAASKREAEYERLACGVQEIEPDDHPLMRRPPAGHGFVYVMSDPREPERIRYVGQTTQPLAIRRRQHLSAASGLMTRDWLRSLVAAGVLPTIAVYEVASLDRLDPRNARKGIPTREGMAIRRLQSKGHSLLNSIVE